MVKYTEDEIIKKIIEIESTNGLNNLYVENIPLWHIIRYRMRGYYFLRNGINDISSGHKSKFTLKGARYFFISFFQFIKLFIIKARPKVCFFGFTRLESVNGFFIDKFIDPIISEANIKGSDFLYFNNQYGEHSIPRNNEHGIIYTDFINLFSLLIGVFVLPYLYIKNRSAYKKVIKVTQRYIVESNKVILYILLKSSTIFIQKKIYAIIFRRLEVKSIVGVSRVTFIPQSLAAKQLEVKVIEVQHGITQGLTNLYSGYNNPVVDPDFFCAFGNFCPSTVFGIDQSKVINVGWAFKDYIKKSSPSIQKSDAVLVISEPQISEKLINFIVVLSRRFPDVYFHIRRHPQEIFNALQLNILKENSHIIDVSSRQCSQIAILPYDFIIGENSSVLYEALSLGKKVGRINCNGLDAIGYNTTNSDGFYYINHIEDFSRFVNTTVINTSILQIYSNFNSSLFKSLIS